MKFALYQMDVVAGDPKRNREKVSEWIEDVCQKEKTRPLTVVLPELWTTGYQLDQLDHLAEDKGKQTIDYLSKLAKKHHIHVIGGSIATKKEGRIYNTAIIINANGECVHTYDKIHLVPMLNEPTYLEAGTNKAAVFELSGIKMGIIICYDLRFPELVRDLALKGAEVLVIPAEWPSARAEHWKVLQQARAIENQFYVLSANSVGSYNGTEYAGHSMVIDPWGSIVYEAGTSENTVFCEIDAKKTKQIREQVPVFKSRRKDLYENH